MNLLRPQNYIVGEFLSFSRVLKFFIDRMVIRDIGQSIRFGVSVYQTINYYIISD